jgi:uncharacterized protein (TIGR03086 family)
MDRYGALERATATFAAVLASVPDDRWQSPSVNPGWSVHDLVNHVVGGNRRYVVLLTGAPTAEVEALRDLDHLGDDPDRAFAQTSAELIAAFARPGALEVTVHHRQGDRSGSDLLTMRVMEHALHGWDLARSIGADDGIDPGVVDTLLGAFDTDETLLVRSGYPPSNPPAAADPQRRLLILTGRTPSVDLSAPHVVVATPAADRSPLDRA